MSKGYFDTSPDMPPKSSYDIIVVLGNPARDDGKPSRVLRQRLQKCIDLFHAGYAPYIFMTGGAAHNSFIESEIMKEYCIERGVPGSCIFQDQLSMNTLDNAKNSLRILNKNDIHNIVIVTSRFHCKRAKLSFEKYGAQVDAVSPDETFWFRLITAFLLPVEWMLIQIFIKSKRF